MQSFTYGLTCLSVSCDSIGGDLTKPFHVFNHGKILILDRDLYEIRDTRYIYRMLQGSRRQHLPCISLALSFFFFVIFCRRNMSFSDLPESLVYLFTECGWLVGCCWKILTCLFFCHVEFVLFRTCYPPEYIMSYIALIYGAYSGSSCLAPHTPFFLFFFPIF